MIFSRIGNSLTRSWNVINRASRFGAPTVDGSVNQFNRRILRNYLTTVGDGKKPVSRPSSPNFDYLTANYRASRFFCSDAPKNKVADHENNEVKPESPDLSVITRTEEKLESNDHEKNEVKEESKRWFVLRITKRGAQGEKTICYDENSAGAPLVAFMITLGIVPIFLTIALLISVTLVPSCLLIALMTMASSSISPVLLVGALFSLSMFFLRLVLEDPRWEEVGRA